jgi:hypothetical protein
MRNTRLFLSETQCRGLVFKNSFIPKKIYRLTLSQRQLEYMFFILGPFLVSAKWSDAADFPCREYTNVLYGSLNLQKTANCYICMLKSARYAGILLFGFDVFVKGLSNEMDIFRKINNIVSLLSVSLLAASKIWSFLHFVIIKCKLRLAYMTLPPPLIRCRKHPPRIKTCTSEVAFVCVFRHKSGFL